MRMEYGLACISGILPLDGEWDSGMWAGIRTIGLDFAVPRSSEHRPPTRLRAALDNEGLAVRFKVSDRYVISRVSATNGPVCTDSCVELFIMPASPGYFNIEVNAGGTMHMGYIEDPRLTPEGGFAKSTLVTEELLKGVSVKSTLPETVLPELQEPTEWAISFKVPYALFERYTGSLNIEPGRIWRANAYKCGDHTSHPHWLCWSPVKGWSFHDPESFGDFILIGNP